MRLVLHPVGVEPTRERLVEQTTRVLDRDALARPVGAAAPASVQENAAGLVLRHLLRQVLGVDARLVGHERRPEARAERRLRLGDPDLGASELRREALHEVVHDLLGLQDGDGRQHPEGVRREQHDGLGSGSLGAVGHVRVAGQYE